MKSQQKQELDGIIDKIIGYFRFHDRKERDDETDMWERINREIRQQEKKTRVREYTQNLWKRRIKRDKCLRNACQ